MRRNLSRVITSSLIVLSILGVTEEVFSARERNGDQRPPTAPHITYTRAGITRIVSRGDHIIVTFDRDSISTVDRNGVMRRGTIADVVTGQGHLVITTSTGREMFPVGGSRPIDDRRVEFRNPGRIEVGGFSGVVLGHLLPAGARIIDGSRLSGGTITTVGENAGTAQITIRGSDDIINLGEGARVFGVATDSNGELQSFSGTIRGNSVFDKDWIVSQIDLDADTRTRVKVPLVFTEGIGANWLAIGSSN